MKKVLLAMIFSVLITKSSFSQIPNYSFENWTTVGTYDVPNQWSTLNNTTAGYGVYTVTKATPSTSGSYS